MIEAAVSIYSTNYTLSACFIVILMPKNISFFTCVVVEHSPYFFNSFTDEAIAYMNKTIVRRPVIIPIHSVCRRKSTVIQVKIPVNIANTMADCR